MLTEISSPNVTNQSLFLAPNLAVCVTRVVVENSLLFSRAVLLAVCRDVSSCDINLPLVHLFLNETLHLLEYLVSMLLSKPGLSIALQCIDVESKVVAIALEDWCRLLLSINIVFWIFGHRVLILLTPHAHGNHCREIFISAWFLPLNLRSMHAFFHARFLQFTYIYSRMVIFTRFRSQGSRWAPDSCKEPVPIDVSPNWSSCMTLLCQELNHFVSLPLIQDAKCTICGVNIWTSFACIIFLEVVSKRFYLPLIVSFFTIIASGCHRLFGYKFVDVCNDSILLIVSVLPLLITDIRIWSLLVRVKFECQWNCQVNRTLHQQFFQDLRVNSLFCYFLQLLDVVDNLSHRHVMKPSNPFILFYLNLLLLFQLHHHHGYVLFFFLFCSIQALYLTFSVLNFTNKEVL